MLTEYTHSAFLTFKSVNNGQVQVKQKQKKQEEVFVSDVKDRMFETNQRNQTEIFGHNEQHHI